MKTATDLVYLQTNPEMSQGQQGLAYLLMIIQLNISQLKATSPSRSFCCFPSTVAKGNQGVLFLGMGLGAGASSVNTNRPAGGLLFPADPTFPTCPHLAEHCRPTEKPGLRYSHEGPKPVIPVFQVTLEWTPHITLHVGP
uniref:Uncharacterized protein n=1 Tax=Molossus molossus TaxID=27622 RepID=A0A7J8BLW2_MOLMO|nr:hypothetical protein HJG59_010112 [Molossus molossus]